jgi:16S rRNA processing protein RimM
LRSRRRRLRRLLRLPLPEARRLKPALSEAVFDALGSPVALPADAVEVGRVLGAWGVQGAIKVAPFAADAQALFSSKRWYLAPSELPRPGGLAHPVLLRVAHAREQGDGIVVTVQDLADRDLAEQLKGTRIFIPRASFPTPDDGEFYWVDLIGLAVLNREGLALGQVVGLLETGPHCVLRVKPAAAEADELLIPFVGVYIDAVEMDQRRIRVDWQPDY